MPWDAYTGGQSCALIAPAIYKGSRGTSTMPRASSQGRDRGVDHVVTAMTISCLDFSIRVSKAPLERFSGAREAWIEHYEDPGAP